ncbi:MAG: hypothetical protein M3P39_07490 [Actinomycetota bacterium]|nr:hypothetical protein [Actinomycetota bacterium]
MPAADREDPVLHLDADLVGAHPRHLDLQDQPVVLPDDVEGRAPRPRLAVEHVLEDAVQPLPQLGELAEPAGASRKHRHVRLLSRG